jgi:hypothetical protein
MIKLKSAYTHIDRAVVLTGTLQIEITSWITTPDAKIYTVEDFIVDANNAKRQINSRTKRVENQELDQLDSLIMMDNSFEGLAESEKEWAKAKIGLLFFVKNDMLEDGMHTIYGKLPQDWELS